MIYIYKFEGGELECELSYHSADLPLYVPEYTELNTAKLNGVDIAELLNDEVVQLIEEKALAEMESKK